MTELYATETFRLGHFGHLADDDPESFWSTVRHRAERAGLDPAELEVSVGRSSGEVVARTEPGVAAARKERDETKWQAYLAFLSRIRENHATTQAEAPGDVYTVVTHD